MKYLIIILFVGFILFLFNNNKEFLNETLNFNSKPDKLKHFYGQIPVKGTLISKFPMKKCHTVNGKLICEGDQIIEETITKKIKTNELQFINNIFIVGYCRINNFLINTGKSIILNCENDNNILTADNKPYVLKYLEWRLSNIDDYKLQFHLVHKNNDHEIHIVSPLIITPDTNLLEPKGINRILYYYEYIPDLSYDSGNIGKIIRADLKYLLPIFESSGFKYHKNGSNEDWYMSKPQKFNSKVGETIIKKITR